MGVSLYGAKKKEMLRNNKNMSQRELDLIKFDESKVSPTTMSPNNNCTLCGKRMQIRDLAAYPGRIRKHGSNCLPVRLSPEYTHAMKYTHDTPFLSAHAYIPTYR